MLDALGELAMQPAYFSRYSGEPPRRTGARHPSISPYGPFQTGDGSVFFGIQNDREWVILCRDILRQPALAADPRFAANRDRVAHTDELTAIIERALGTLTADEASQALEAAGIASARLRTPEEFTRHPQLRARLRWRQVHTSGGDIDALLPPVEIAGQTPVVGPVPALGEHTDAVRAEFGTAPAEGPTR